LFTTGTGTAVLQYHAHFTFHSVCQSFIYIIGTLLEYCIYVDVH